MEAQRLHQEYLQQIAAMEERHRNIEKRKLKRRGIVDENDSDFECPELDSGLSPDLKRRKTPYCT